MAPVYPHSAERGSARRRATLYNPQESKASKVRKVYYNPMRKLTLMLPLLALSLLASEPVAAQQPSSLKTNSLESHEGMTITARPWTDPALYKEKFPKKSPFAAGIVAIQVVFRNDSDDSMKINLERIRLNLKFSEEDHQSLYPLSSEEATNIITRPSTKNLTTRRLPIPLGVPKVGKDKKWIEVEQSISGAGVQASVVAPHSSVQGLLYFDLRSQFELLNNAHLYVPEVVAIEKNHGLLYFEIDLSRSAER